MQSILLKTSSFLFIQITFCNDVGRYELEVTTFQMAVLFAWNQRPREKLSYESLKLATELPDNELRKTLMVKMCLLYRINLGSQSNFLVQIKLFY